MQKIEIVLLLRLLLWNRFLLASFYISLIAVSKNGLLPQFIVILCSPIWNQALAMYFSMTWFIVWSVKILNNAVNLKGWMSKTSCLFLFLLLPDVPALNFNSFQSNIETWWHNAIFYVVYQSAHMSYTTALGQIHAISEVLNLLILPTCKIGRWRCEQTWCLPGEGKQHGILSRECWSGVTKTGIPTEQCGVLSQGPRTPGAPAVSLYVKWLLLILGMQLTIIFIVD